MSGYNVYRGNAENKLFYTIDNLVGGINTEFSDDNSSVNDFLELINLDMDLKGSLKIRKGFGNNKTLSEIFRKFQEFPDLGKEQVSYVVVLKNDNNVIKELSFFNEDKGYREYQKKLGFQENTFSFLMITTNKEKETSTSWLFSVKLPKLRQEIDGSYKEDETIELNFKKEELKVKFNILNKLFNVINVSYFNDVYFLDNNKGIVKYDKNTKEYSYIGSVFSSENKAYKPSAMEIRKIGFNLLGNDPISWLNTDYISTNESIYGIYLTDENNKPVLKIPNNGKFKINILYSGKDDGFDIELKEKENKLKCNIVVNSTLSKSGLLVYDVVFQVIPTSEIEFKLVKKNTTIDPYYDFYSVGKTINDIEVEPLDIKDYNMLEMQSRIVYYKDKTIFFSEINNPTYIPNYNYVILPLDETDTITKIQYFRNIYIIFTKYTIYKMVGEFGSSNFKVSLVNPTIGCIAPNSVVNMDNSLIFLSNNGLYMLKSSEFRDDLENVKELDFKVKSLTKSLNSYNSNFEDLNIKTLGLNNNAYGIRYGMDYYLFRNDKNMFNRKLVSNFDVLVYKTQLNAFTTFKFKNHPNFLYLYNNSLYTFKDSILVKQVKKDKQLLDIDFKNVENINKVGFMHYQVKDKISGKLLDLEGVNRDVDHLKITSKDGVRVFNWNKFNYLSNHYETYHYSIEDVSKKTRLFTMCKELSKDFNKEIHKTINSYDNKIKIDLTFKKVINTESTFKVIANFNMIEDILNITNINYEITLDEAEFIKREHIINNNKYIATEEFTIDVSRTSTIEFLFGITTNSEILSTGQVFNLIELEYNTLSNNRKLEVYVENGYLYVSYDKKDSVIKEQLCLVTSNEINKHKFHILKTADNHIEFRFVGERDEENKLFYFKLEDEDNSKPLLILGGGYEKIDYSNLCLYNFSINIDDNIQSLFMYLNYNTLTNNIIKFYSNDVNYGLYITLDNNELVYSDRFNIDYNSKVSFSTNKYNVNEFLLGIKLGLTTLQELKKQYEVIIDILTIGEDDNLIGISCKKEGDKYYIVLNELYDLEIFRTPIEVLKSDIETILLSEKLELKVQFSVSNNSCKIYINDYLLVSEYKLNINLKKLNNFNLVIEKTTIFLYNIYVRSLSEYIEEYSIKQLGLYEYGLSQTDYNTDEIEYILETKGLNFNYPQHIKKLKKIYIKGVGGYDIQKFNVYLKCDGFLKNDLEILNVSINDNGNVVYEYEEVSNAMFSNKSSRLDISKLDKMKLGTATYETKELIIPAKGKNFNLRITGKAKDNITFDNIGFICKLGKVKES